LIQTGIRFFLLIPEKAGPSFFHCSGPPDILGDRQFGLQEAQNARSPTEKLVEKVAKWYTPLVVFGAATMATIPWAFGRDTGMHYFHTALVLLVVACPCALVISTPVTYVCGLAHAAQRGLLVKGGVYLETLGKIQTLCFDKTGTLTVGVFQLTELVSINGSTRDEALKLLLSIELESTHPMASAICLAAREEGATPYEMVEDFENLPGEGVSATVGTVAEREGAVLVGNRRMAERLGWPTGEAAVPAAWTAKAGTIGWLGLNGKCIATFCAMDSVRPEAAEAVTLLHKIGVRTVMLTGDNRASAQSIQHQVGLNDVHYELFPKDKMELVDQEKKGGSRVVAMVGDGVNDAPALAQADLGLAMGVTGTVVAMETADISLMDNDLRKLAQAVLLGRRVQRKILQNVVFSIGSKVCL